MNSETCLLVDYICVHIRKTTNYLFIRKITKIYTHNNSSNWMKIKRTKKQVTKLTKRNWETSFVKHFSYMESELVSEKEPFSWHKWFFSCQLSFRYCQKRQTYTCLSFSEVDTKPAILLLPFNNKTYMYHSYLIVNIPSFQGWHKNLVFHTSFYHFVMFVFVFFLLMWYYQGHTLFVNCI